MDKRIILGINLKNRLHDAPEVQKLLTEYGCTIKTRLGLHEVDEKSCSSAGLLLLELVGEEARCRELIEKLSRFAGLELQQMAFSR